MNPINEKLSKMFGKRKKFPDCGAIGEGVTFECSGSKKNRVSSELTSPDILIEKLKEELREEQKMTKKLSEKLRDHELLEEFYLRELNNRKTLQDDLENKLLVVT